MNSLSLTKRGRVLVRKHCDWNHYQMAMCAQPRTGRPFKPKGHSKTIPTLSPLLPSSTADLPPYWFPQAVRVLNPPYNIVWLLLCIIFLDKLLSVAHVVCLALGPPSAHSDLRWAEPVKPLDQRTDWEKQVLSGKTIHVFL